MIVGIAMGTANRDLNQTRVLPKKRETRIYKLHNEDGLPSLSDISVCITIISLFLFCVIDYLAAS